jgi:hypothetical protein
VQNRASITVQKEQERQNRTAEQDRQERMVELDRQNRPGRAG